MILSPMDWIDCGHGKLYSALFHSRCLLFRFYHEGCALLVHHEKTVFSGPTQEFVDSVICKQPGGLPVPYSPSSTAELSTIRAQPPLSFVVGKEATMTHPFEKITLKIEPCKESMSRLQSQTPSVQVGSHCREMFPDLWSAFKEVAEDVSLKDHS